MAHRTRLVWDDGFTAYDFGPTHPMGPVRLDLTTRLAEALGVLDEVEVVSPGVASDELLETVHDPGYVAAVRAASRRPRPRRRSAAGSAPRTTRPSRGCTRPAPGSSQGTVDLCDAVWSGEIDHGVNYCGGLHHAMATHAAGFCIYNDIAVGIQRPPRQRRRAGRLRRHRRPPRRRRRADLLERPAGPHHLGARVRSGALPRHGLARATSAARTPGAALSTSPCPPGTGDSEWLRAIESVVPQLVAAFDPEVLVTAARLRQPPPGPAGPPVGLRRRPAPGPRVPAPAGPRPRRRQVGGPRRWRLRARRRRAPVLDPPRRHRGTCAGPGEHARARRTWRDHVLEITGRDGPDDDG